MAWYNEIPILVRVLTNDLSDEPKYSDDRIRQCIAVAAAYVQFDVVLDKTYSVDVENVGISPDPTEGQRDEIFISLVGLRASCIIDQSNFRTRAALEGIRAVLGPASLSTSNSLAGYKEILEHGPCQLYAELTEHWDVQNATAIAAILSPFVGNKFDPFMLPYDDHRHKNFYS